MFGSFTGEGKRLLDNLGTLADSDIGGCIDSPAISTNLMVAFQQSLTIVDPQPFVTLDGFVADPNAFKDDMKTIEFENNFGNGLTATGATGKGGSSFATTDRAHRRRCRY